MSDLANDDRLAVTKREAARLLGISLAGIDRLIRRGDLRRLIIGKAPRIEVAELRRFVAEHREQ